jgi:Ricin-type beta-trefoil lectin domain./Protein metal binding site.
MFLLLSLCLCALLLASPYQRVNGQGGIDTSKWYRLIAKHSGKCVDVRNASISAGERLMQYTCHSGDNQKFQFSSAGDGYFVINTGNSHLCVDQFGATQTPGGAVGQYFCHYGQNQQVLPATSGGYYSFSFRHSGQNLDVANGSTANGALLIQYTAHGGDNQLFTLEETTAPCTESGDTDSDGWCNPYDCDDNDPDTFPGAPTFCEMGVDRDCNGLDDYEECFGFP